MSEGGGVEVLFEGGEAEEVEGEKSSGIPDPIAAAIVIDAARFDPKLSAKAIRYLDQHRRYVAVQTEHLIEAGEVQISHLRLRRWSDRVRVGLQFFLVLIGTLIGLAVLGMLYGAVTSRTVVVEAFQAPPILSGRGVNGNVIAHQVLDALQKLQDATHGPSQGLRTIGAWSSDIRVELPETGISIGEIDRLLHERLGHDVHIDGDLVLSPAGDLELTIRGNGVAAKTFSGSVNGLDTLTTKAAEYVYGRSQPWLYAIYLNNMGRYQEIVDFMPATFARASEAERPNLANAWGIALQNVDRLEEAGEKFGIEKKLSAPHSVTWWKGWTNIITILAVTKGEEAAWREGTQFLRENDNAPASEKAEERFLSTIGLSVTDLPLTIRSLKADAAYNGGAGASSFATAPSMADVYAMMHDPINAAHYMSISDASDPTAKLEGDLLQGYAALEQGTAVAAVAPLEDFYKGWLGDASMRSAFPDSACFLGLAYGLSGRMVEAEGVFKRAGRWSRCYAFHGDVLAHAGDTAGAARVWAEGLRIAPSMAWIYLSRGAFELARGQLSAAQADFATAHVKSPHFADPLKGLGDVLARAGRWKEALAKYDEALTYAPAWTALHQAHDVAAKHSSV